MSSNSMRSSMKWVTLVLVFLAHAFLIGQMYAVPALVPTIVADTGHSHPQVLFVFSAINIALVFTQLPGGIIGDRYSVRWVIGGGIVVAGIATTLRWAFPSLGGLLATSLLLGVGVGVVLPNLIKLLWAWFEGGQLGLALGINLSGFNVGAGIATSISGGIVLGIVGRWQSVFLAYGLASIALGIVWMLVVRTPAGGSRKGTPSGTTEETAAEPAETTAGRTREILTLRETYVASAIGLFGLIAVSGGLTVLPSIGAEEPFGVPDLLLGLPLYIGIIGQLVLPSIAPRFGLKSFMYFGLTGNIIGVLITGFATSLVVFSVGLVIAGFFGGGLFGVLYVVPTRLPAVQPDTIGTASGVILSLARVGAILGPVLGGVGLEQYGINGAVLAITLPAVLGLPGIWLLKLDEDTQNRSGIPA